MYIEKLQIFNKNKIIKNEDVYLIAQKLKNNYEGIQDEKFIFESKKISKIYVEMSLIGINPSFKIIGKENEISIISLNKRGEKFLKLIKKKTIFKKNITEENSNLIKFYIEKKINYDNKKNINISFIIRDVINILKIEEETSLGLFGAFSYDFVRVYENIPEIKEDEKIPYINLFFFDTFIKQDIRKNITEIIVFRDSENECFNEISKIEKSINKYFNNDTVNFSTKNIKCDHTKEEYKDMVQHAKNLAKKGDIFEVVFSKSYQGDFQGDELLLYDKYRNVNPAPYLFYFSFSKDQYLIGASPEMMVKIKNKTISLVPISGTIERGYDIISDHENELKLLNCKKERSELDMLIDLGRNDLKKVCKGSIKVDPYRIIERSSKVMHTVSYLQGKMKEECDFLDAIFACHPAGTLSGCPKVQAMIEIEKAERNRRNFYGGIIGYINLNGDMDSGIMIRTININKGKFTLRVGATLLYDSDPEKEYLETENKAKALINILKKEEN